MKTDDVCECHSENDYCAVCRARDFDDWTVFVYGGEYLTGAL